MAWCRSFRGTPCWSLPTVPVLIKLPDVLLLIGIHFLSVSPTRKCNAFSILSEDLPSAVAVTGVDFWFLLHSFTERTCTLTIDLSNPAYFFLLFVNQDLLSFTERAFLL